MDCGEIGRGNFGTVNKMLHRDSFTEMAVKVFKILSYFISVKYLLSCNWTK